MKLFKKILLSLLCAIMAIGCVACDETPVTGNGGGGDTTQQGTGNGSENGSGNGEQTGGNGSENGSGTETTPPETLKDDTEDMSGKKIRVFLLTGQSNAVGVADTVDIPTGLDRSFPDVKFYVNGDTTQNNVGNFNQWTTVKEGYGIHLGCSGSELGMASVLSQVYPKRGEDYTCAIIKYAWGGTGLAEKWLSESGYETYRSTGGNSEYVEYNGKMVGVLYKNMMDTINTALQGLREEGYTPEVSGMAWMQGCNDAYSMTWANNYDGMLECMITDVRNNLNAPNMPVAIGEIGILYTQYSDVIRDKQYKVGTTFPDCRFIDTGDLNIKVDDWWHFDSASLYKLGRRYASAFLTSYRDLVVPTTASYSQESSVQTVYSLPQYVEATTESGIQLPLEVEWEGYGRSMQTGTVNVNGAFKRCVGGAKASVTISNDPDIDGRIDILGDKAWESAKKIPLSAEDSSSKGSYVQVLTTDKGLYLGGMIFDEDMITWLADKTATEKYDLRDSDQVHFYIDTNTDRETTLVSEYTHAFYLSSVNTMTVFRGTSAGDWGTADYYRYWETRDNDYFGKIKHAVKQIGTPAFGDRELYFESGSAAVNDKDIGYMFEIFVPYSTLGITANEKDLIRINVAQTDKYSWTTKTIYKAFGGNFYGYWSDYPSWTYQGLDYFKK